MLGYIEGEIKYKTSEVCIVMNQGLGYTIYLTKTLLSQCADKQSVSFFLYHHITENTSKLYGFKYLEEKDLFSLLLSVSGIGPKNAIGMMDVSLRDLVQAISCGDTETLCTLPGIGKKTAERLVLELKNKISTISESGTALSSSFEKSHLSTPVANNDALEALLNLGYSRLEAVRMLGHVPIDIQKTEEIIRFALKYK